MAATQNQITGGAFQDINGNILANGYLEMQLNQDEQVQGVAELVSGIVVTIPLDLQGNVQGTDTVTITNIQITSNVLTVTLSGSLAGKIGVGDVVVFPSSGMTASFLQGLNVKVLSVNGSTFTANFTHANYGPTADTGSATIGLPVLIWPNDVMTPLNSWYIVKGFTAAGQLVWGPNNQQVLSAPIPYNLGVWVPNQLQTWNPPLQAVTLQTNEINNGVQNILDLHAGTNITLTDNGSGRVTIAAPAATQGPRIARLWRYWVYSWGNNATNTHAAIGYTNLSAVGVATPINATATEPAAWDLRTAASTNQQAYWEGDNGAVMTLASTYGTKPLFQVRGIAAGGKTNFRYWIVWAGSGLVTGGEANLKATNPNGLIAGFRYDDSADSASGNWKAYFGTSNTLFTVVDTGVAVNTAASKIFQCNWDGTSFTYYIAGVLVATITPTTNPAPPSASGMALMIVSVDNNIAANANATHFSLQQVYEEQG